MLLVESQCFDEERAFYGSDGIKIKNCRFDGEADGESALKESRNVVVDGCYWNLRYPFWHNIDVSIADTELSENCRAALWYSKDVNIYHTKLHGIKAIRECQNVSLKDCDIISTEFGWFSHDIQMDNCQVRGEYFMLHSGKMDFKDVHLNGKYSLQYVSNSVFDHCVFDTKDAFWHAKNVVVRNSIIKSEYLAWYAENITFENCIITGTQPFCYCKGLELIQCEMHEADLCFEKSEVEAQITTPVISIKNPASGCIRLPAVEEIIQDDPNAKGIISII